MYCSKCGKQLPDGARFCDGCGAGQFETRAARNAAKRFNPLFVIIPIAVIVIAAAAGLGIGYLKTHGLRAQQTESADAALQSGDYSTAVSEYEEALTKDPENTEVALKLAEAYLEQGKYNQALQTLKEVSISASDPLYESYIEMTAVAEFNPELKKVVADNYPEVELHFSCDGTANPSATVIDNGKERAVKIETEDSTVIVKYNSDDNEGRDSEVRSGSASLDLYGYKFDFDYEYKTPHLKEAVIKLVSTDVSEYPTVKCYFSIADAVTGEPIEGIGIDDVKIMERAQGGEFVYREVESVETLGGTRGLNISLVADKSDSISGTDMQKIKKVMTEFVRSLNFNEGDRAEVLAFDSIVQQMCSFTDSANLLESGINNMYTDGMTALYDAVYDGIAHASLRGGARCVIAFTDGIDNRSRVGMYDVINYATTQQVPVYVIGVGDDVEESCLRTIADETGGKYWFIDDLYDLEEIFEQIYSEQKKYYEVCYVTDKSLSTFEERSIFFELSGNGCNGTMEESFVPVYSLGENDHESRYEVFRESLTWEEAAARCEQLGGHLATVTSSTEEETVIALLEQAGVKYCWLGGYTSYDDNGQVFGHWVTGETFGYSAWSSSEPSRVDQDGTDEWYIMLWNVASLNGWYWNDQRNDPVSAVAYMASGMGFVCEFEN